MSILGTLESTLGGVSNSQPGVATPGTTATGNATAAIVSQVIALIQSRPGGLAGLVQAFQQGGLGHLVQSWIGTGQNLPVSADQLHNILGSDWLAHITQATGLPQAQVEQHVTAALPQIIDHLSPGGQLPQGDLATSLAGVAQRLLHG